MSSVASVKCQKSRKFTKKKIFFNSNLHSIHTEKQNFEESFEENLFKNFIIEGFLSQIFYLNEDLVFY